MRIAFLAVVACLAFGCAGLNPTQADEVNARLARIEARLDTLGSDGSAVASAVPLFRRRLDVLGIDGLSVRQIDDKQIEVVVPGITTTQATSITNALEAVHNEDR